MESHKVPRMREKVNWRFAPRYNTTDAVEAALCVPRMREGHRGFTLIEMVIVMAIMGVLVSIALPAFSQWRSHSAVNDASMAIMGHLKQARNIAMAESRDVRVVFSTAAYTFDKDTTGSCSNCKDLTFSLSQYSANLTVSTNASGDIFKFSSTGTGTSRTVTLADSADASYSKKITVNGIGRAYFAP